ncbi:Transcriptional regulator, DeoR family [Serinicoccus hydrothermalis]|uniref:Transcriptional regulator, DeoR family n=1 Tax=Serinicoccus hydrothermalis TaxID=1758689 RepID=A0A1B1NFP3_9MICO|nr:YafY family protein [Serinicoccus hydrothermalis]ANS80243.1 Transcriptional regulator, DeoR family [Serinicoccus hydrothermalis]
MTDPTTRVLRLLGLFQTRALWSAQELADRLGVTTRSIRRDIERLRELGYPVRASSGVGGGYQLGSGGSLPPLLLDQDEAVAVAVCLRLAAGGTVAGVSEAAVRTLAKLDQVLPAHAREQVAAIHESTVTVGSARAVVDPEVLMAASRACRDRLRTTLRYVARDGEASTRRVEPATLVAVSHRWYLLAFDLDRDDWRSFRLDRVQGLTVGTMRNAARPVPDPASYITRSVTQAPYRWVARARVRMGADELAEHVSPLAGEVTELADGWCELVTGGESLDYLAAELVLLGADVEVLEPPELVAHLDTVRDRLR